LLLVLNFETRLAGANKISPVVIIRQRRMDIPKGRINKRKKLNMAITRQQKEEIVQKITDSFNRTKSVVFADFQGLKMPEIEELRAKCIEQGLGYTVAKKTLLNIALEKVGIKDVDTRQIKGSLATVFGFEDEVAPAKIIADFAKSHEAIEIKGGILEGRVVPAEEVIKLSKLPSKTELYAKIVGSINAPVSGFVNVLAGNIRGLVYALNAIKESKS
jgi:large subunit ribosomal protein L10